MVDCINAIMSRRTIRFFKEGLEIGADVLGKIVDAGRYAASASNIQPVD